MIAQLLAEAAGNADSMNYLTTGAITAICTALTGIVAYTKGKTDRKVKIENQPIEVSMQERYVTRTEFAEFKGELKADVREMRGSYDRLTMLIDERDKKLTEMIERVAQGAFEGRRRIHDVVNQQSKEIAALGVKADVSKSIGKLGAAIMETIKPKNQS